MNATRLIFLCLAILGCWVVPEIHGNFLGDLITRNQDVHERALGKDFVEVTIKNGTLRGFTARAVNNKTIYSFTKVPFAQPPVGDLRFRNPEPYNGWGDSVYDATALSPACPASISLVPFSEDCLYLNIYSSRNGSEEGKEPAPVMIFMYGGAWVFGETTYYTGYRLLANDAVLVIPNYRLGMMGFFSTGDEASPGNYGLKDQLLAMKWVQENIAAFGGDPNRVTIFGESAGGASVIYQLLSPAARGLFHSVIAQSGSAIAVWGEDKAPLKTAKRVATELHCPTEDTHEMVECFRGRTAANLTYGFSKIFGEDFVEGELTMDGTNPVVEPDLPGAFLTESPYKILREGRFPDVPVMMGSTAEEGAVFLGAFHFLGFGSRPNETIENPAWLRENIVRDVLKMYYTGESAGGIPIEETMFMTFLPGHNRQQFDEKATFALRDVANVYAIQGAVYKTTEILSQFIPNVYLYSFDHRSSNWRNSLWYYVFNVLAPLIGGKEPPYEHGVSHADDLIYEFNFPFILEEEDEKFSKMFCKMWVDFATTGNPTPEPSDDHPEWPQYHWRDSRRYMILKSEPSIGENYPHQWRTKV